MRTLTGLLDRKIGIMKRAFSFIELIIVVAILGILAAIVLPIYREQNTLAKEAAAKDNLRLWRNAIELYAAKHDGVPPGYGNDGPSGAVGYNPLIKQLFGKDKYLPKYPVNPFSNIGMPRLIQNGEEFPTEAWAYSMYGWLYKAETKTITLNWPGTDSAGVRHFDY